MTIKEERILDIEEAEKIYENIKIDEAVPSIEDTILMLLSVIPNSLIISRTLLMKEVFLFYSEFLKEFGINSDPIEDAGYYAYKYGPYSLRVNISIASLAISGKIKIMDFSDYLNQNKEYRKIENNLDLNHAKNKYLACFATDISFDKVYESYSDKFKKIGINKEIFKLKLSDFKRMWDQKTPRGIIQYIYSQKNYRNFIQKSELKELYSEVFAGLVKEDYTPRMWSLKNKDDGK